MSPLVPGRSPLGMVSSRFIRMVAHVEMSFLFKAQ